jgi:hypothetical protein
MVGEGAAASQRGSHDRASGWATRRERERNKDGEKDAKDKIFSVASGVCGSERGRRCIIIVYFYFLAVTFCVNGLFAAVWTRTRSFPFLSRAVEHLRTT